MLVNQIYDATQPISIYKVGISLYNLVKNAR
jgi:hypothetical protein